MFVLCPHCQFLVALDPASGQPPSRCPRCGRSLHEDVKAEPSDPLDAAETAATSPLLEAAGAVVGQSDDAAVAATPAVTIAEAATGAESATGDGTEEAAPAATVQLESAESMRDPEFPDMSSDAADAVVLAETMPEPAGGEVSGEAALPDSSSGSAPDPDTAIEPTAATRSAAPAARRKPGSTPSFARATRPAPAPDRRRRWLRVGAIAALALLLGLQLLLADRTRLAADARWRPALTVLCGVLRCTLPPWREPSAFTLLSRDVRPHPTASGVLHVTATFRNDARWPQPWPSLLLTLSDLDGRDVGARVFAAREYLGAPPTRSRLASGQSAMIAMEIVEPAPRIVAFTFDFR